MLDKKITRKEFFKMGFLGIIAAVVLPFLKIFRNTDNVSHRDAEYYKNLAG